MKRLLIPMLVIGLIPSLSAGVSVFQEGLDGYAGTLDTEIRSGTRRTTDLSEVQVLNPDGSDESGYVQVLMRFEGMFGTDPGQIPPGKQVFSVVLTLTIEGPGPGNDLSFHRMNKAWDETVTWEEFDPINDDGILSGDTYWPKTADDTEAKFEPDGTTITSPVGVYDIPLDPATVQAWLDGTAPNYGWGILPTGTDGVDFPSSEDPDVTTRPKLTVTWGEAGQPFSTGLRNVGPDGFEITLEDGIGPGANQVDPATIQVQLDGVDVETTTSKAGTTTTVSYSTTDYLESGSQHVTTISFSDNGTPPTAQSEDLSFQVVDYATIPIEFAVDEGAVNKSLSGFRVHPHKMADARPDGNNLPGPFLQLADGYIDPATGQPYENLIFRDDPQVAQSYPFVEFDANDFTVVSTVVNMEHLAGVGTQIAAGNFNTNDVPALDYPNDPVPGIPGTDWGGSFTDTDDPGFNNIAVEFLTFLELPQGLYRMGVNSDDGFVVDTGITPTDALALRLGLFDGGRGAADSTFMFEVLQDGIYPFRLVWWEGGGGASVEWFMLDRAGTRTLVNDSRVATSVKAYQEGPVRPQVKSVDPAPGTVNVPVGANIQIVLEDGTTQVQTGSVQLTVNGQAVTSNVSKAGALTTITYDPPADFPELTDITVGLTFSDNAATPNVRSESYSFTSGTGFEIVFTIDDTTTWRYLNNGSDQGTAWREAAFNDSAWSEGPALLAAESGATAEPIRTTLSRTGPAGEQIITDYFRTRFTLDALPPGNRLRIRHVVDDGVIVYVNGAEVHRFNVATDPADYLTLAQDHENAYEGPFIVVADNLVVGENVIAAELHQGSAGSSDSVFGLELAIVTSAPVAEEPFIDPPVVSGSDITITWSNGGELQTSPDLQTWEGTGNSSGSFSEPLGTSGNKYYRVVRP